MTTHYRWVVNDLWTLPPFDWIVQGSMEPQLLNQEVNVFLPLLFFCFWGTVKIGQIRPIMGKKRWLLCSHTRKNKNMSCGVLSALLPWLRSFLGLGTTPSTWAFFLALVTQFRPWCLQSKVLNGSLSPGNVLTVDTVCDVKFFHLNIF